jgi:hypothetical protein
MSSAAGSVTTRFHSFFAPGGEPWRALRSAGELGFVAIELSLAGIAPDFLQSGWLGCGSGHSDLSGGFAMLSFCA